MGSYRQVTEAWKAQVTDVLKGRGKGSRSALARRIGVASSAITQLLAPGTSMTTSRIAAAVAEDTGVPLPDDVDEDLSDVMYEVSRLSAQGKRTALQIVRTLRLAEDKAKG